MITASDTSISQTLSVFASYNLEVSFLVPTETGMQKSIMDAPENLRDYFLAHNIHDYSSQDQGTENKINKIAYLVFNDHVEETQISLYRPNTKNGDPRIWIYGLKQYANSYNLIALLFHSNSIYVINCSNASVLDSIRTSSTPLGAIAQKSKPKPDSIADELVEKLTNISSLGYVPTVKSGDTGIGMTLQNLLGLPPDSSKLPDYKGIELKSKRISKSKTRFTLFSNVPAWDLSPITTAWHLLMKYGYIGKDGKWRLSHQIDVTKPNSIGLVLQMDWSNRWLKQNHFDQDTSLTTHVTTWELETLAKRLMEKHNETFWVYANKRGSGANEEFHFVTAQHTRSPIEDNLYLLLETGLIQVDYTLSIKNESTRTVRDHGYLFKINPEDIPALIPCEGTYDLTSI